VKADAKPWLARGLSTDRRIESGVAEVVRIIRPEEWAGYVNDTSRKHRWQHVEACRGRAAGAIRDIAAAGEFDEPVPPPVKKKLMLRAVEQMRAAQDALADVPWSPAGAARVGDFQRELASLAAGIEASASKIKRRGNSAKARIRKVQKELAIRRALDLICDFSNARPTTSKNRGSLRDLASVLYGAATGEEGGPRHAHVVEYFKENWSSVVGKVKKKQPTIARPSAELISAVENDPWLKKREQEWLQPRRTLRSPA
jgi:hypothetical protein